MIGFAPLRTVVVKKDAFELAKMPDMIKNGLKGPLIYTFYFNQMLGGNPKN